MKDVIIIGAGPAGLSAALELLKKTDDYNVTVLESSESIGGISKTVNFGGNRMDIGGHRFFSKDPRIMKWWLNVLPLQGSKSYDDKVLDRESPLSSNGPDPEKEDRTMLIRNRVSRIYYNGKFFDYPISMKLKTIENMGFYTTLKAGFSYLHSTVKKLPENSLENFYINRFGKILYSMFFEGYTEKVWGRHPSKISADWGSQRVRGLSIKAILKDMFKKVLPSSKGDINDTETSLIEQFYYPKYGPGQLWETVAKEIEKLGGTIKFNSEVVSISKNGEKIESVTIKSKNETYNLNGDIFISSMPLCDLVSQLNDVPQKIKEIAVGLPYRDFVTVGLLVDKLKLKNTTDIKTLGGIVPDDWIYVQDTNVKLGRIQIFNNWSPYMVKDPENTVFVGLEYFCKENDDFWNMSEKECADFASSELRKLGIIEDNASVLEFHREKVKKAYPAYFDTYSSIDKLIDYLNTLKNLYCVGRNGQHRYNNMDHSMATAFEAVKNIINGESSKYNIWNVNTDESYNEAKN